ncbi:hypothetical protein M3Y98_00990900 [Aphelenchoides besseyi]|nr:hypothetical protein M3Y98_00990900 [Aphelenchoides besseyi]KAI6194811.1 hypothetical protein M3Y96_01164800 [Aphelenchoides besseyi]
MFSVRTLALLCIVPLAAMALECNLQTDPLREIGAKIKQAVSDTKSYTCPQTDRYCIMFQGNLEVGGKNETFSVASCESDIRHYLGPVGDKIHEKIAAKCEKTGTIHDKVGPLSYYFNCCTEDNCNTVSGAGTIAVRYVMMTVAALCLALPLYL